MHHIAYKKFFQLQLLVTPFTRSNADWRESFDNEGWSKCGKENLFIAGFYRGPSNKGYHPIRLLEEAKCCSSISAYSGQSGKCEDAIWSLDRYVFNILRNLTIIQIVSSVPAIRSLHFLLHSVSNNSF